jgi:hypothetical protein
MIAPRSLNRSHALSLSREVPGADRSLQRKKAEIEEGLRELHQICVAFGKLAAIRAKPEVVLRWSTALVPPNRSIIR